MTLVLNKIKNITLLFAAIFLATTLFAQQKPQFTQYIMNEYIVNPALSGIENYTDLKLSHRHQWVGLDEAPVTTYLTINGPIGKTDNNTNATTIFPIEGDDPLHNTHPTQREVAENYSAPSAHHGIGLQVINDAAGPFTNLSVMATYAYHLPIGKRTTLSAGIGVGGSKFSLNTNKLSFGDAIVDNAVYNSGEIGKTHFDLNAGLWLYSLNYFIGFSALQLVPQTIDFSSKAVTLNRQGKFVPHIFTTAGYRFYLSDEVTFIPSIMVKAVAPVPVQVDVNAKITYNDIVWIGGTYRGAYGYAAMAGFNAFNHVTVSYSYDYSTTQINSISHGTHEILIGFILGNKYSDNTCPKNIW